MSTFYFLVSLTADLLIVFDATIIRYEISVYHHHELIPKLKTKISQILGLSQIQIKV